MNSINIMGRACAKPVLKYLAQQGLACSEFTLAVDQRYGPKDANGKRKAMFFAVVAWGKTAETISGYLEKGQTVAITGRLTQEEFTPAGQDKPVQKTRIVCESYTLGQKAAGQSTNTDPPPPPANNPTPAPTDRTEEPPDDLLF
jgi:single-strand DNA-binding protein